jgi:DNA-binding NarL/FixJ family response regulator
MSVRVLVADDQEIVRAGLTMILNAQPGIEVVAEAANGQRAVEIAQRLRPDVCLFDVRMPGVDGIEATGRLAGPASPIRWPSSSSRPSISTSMSTPPCAPAPAASC